MLPFGRKNARRCTECDITCHANCAHLVPDFCGMKMEVANELLRSMQDIKRRREDREQRRPPTSRQEQIQTAAAPSLETQMGQMNLGAPLTVAPGPPAAPVTTDAFGRPVAMPHPQYGIQPPPQDRPYYPQQSPPPTTQSPPYGAPVPQSRPPGRVPVPYPQEAPPPQRPPPGAYDPNAGYGTPYSVSSPHMVCFD